MALLKVEYYRDLGFAILRAYTNSSISLPPTYGLDVSFWLLLQKQSCLPAACFPSL